MSIHLIGDLHSDLPRLNSLIKQMKPGDTMISCGEISGLLWDGLEEKQLLDYLESLPMQFTFIDGNHDNFSAIYSYPVETWNGGKVHKIRNNVFHLMRGQVFEFKIEDLKFFTFGGGYSIDKDMRITDKNNENANWWEEEMPNQEEYDEGKRNLEKHNWTVDYIITHTLNKESIPILAGLERYNGIKQSCPKELPLNYYLEDIRKFTSYKEWFFGHFHKDRRIDFTRQTCLFLDTVKLQ